jgi:hypothetical protein
MVQELSDSQSVVNIQMSGKVAMVVSGQSFSGHLSINCQVVITSLTAETVDH